MNWFSKWLSTRMSDNPNQQYAEIAVPEPEPLLEKKPLTEVELLALEVMDKMELLEVDYDYADNDFGISFRATLYKFEGARFVQRWCSDSIRITSGETMIGTCNNEIVKNMLTKVARDKRIKEAEAATAKLRQALASK